MANYAAALETACNAARMAGSFLLAKLHAGIGPDPAPAETLIREKLREITPDYGYASSGGLLSPPKDAERHQWLVSPVDDPGALQRGWRGPAVSVALLRDDLPVLGVVHAFHWPDDEGTLYSWAEGMPGVLRNGQPLSARPGAPDTLVLPWEADLRTRKAAHLAAPHRFRTIAGPALGMALAATGEARACIALRGVSGCGLAAGHALLRAAGLDLLSSDGSPVRYSAAGEPTTGDVYAGGPAGLAQELAQRPWAEILGEKADPPDKPYDLCAPSRKRLVPGAGMLRRAQGCLLGQLAGDALGALVESVSVEEIRRRYPGGLRRLADGGAFDTLAGQPTDDSEMALMLARSILRARGCSASQAAMAYRWWCDSGPFDIGGTTSRALSAARTTADPAAQAGACRQAASLTSQANGALMRVSPLGIFGAGRDAAEVARWADEDAQLTHPHPNCRHASAIFAASLACAIRHGADARETHRFALAGARRLQASTELVAALEQAATAPPPDFVTQQGWVLIALQNAFYQALHAPSLEEGIVDTVMRGGDTDTNAAIAGALLGAIHGRAGIPFQWLDRVLTCRPLAGLPGVHNPRPRALWPVDALVLAEQLLWLGLQGE